MSYKVYNEQETTGFNANDTASVTDSLSVEPASIVIVYIFPNTGNHAVHILQVQVSPDGTNWQDEVTATISGADKHAHVDIAGHKFIRVKCAKAEGSASTVDINIVPTIEE